MANSASLNPVHSNISFVSAELSQMAKKTKQFSDIFDLHISIY